MRPLRDTEQAILLRRGTLLVLYGALTRTLRTPEAHQETAPGNYQLSFRVDEAERRALNWLTGAIERAVPDCLSDELAELIAEEKRWIMSRHK